MDGRLLAPHKMGIDNLYRLLKEKAPRAIKTMGIKDLKGFKIGIDASIAVYQWYSIGITRNIINTDEKYINHIQGSLFRTIKLQCAGLQLLYIFDGKPPSMKSKTIEARREMRSTGKSAKVPSSAFEEVKSLLTAMGVGVMNAPGEAEAQGAILTQNGSLDMLATEDLDALVFGAKCVIKGLNSAAKTVTLISRDDVLQELGITSNQFIDLSILLGCDYTNKLPGIGPVKALNLIQKHGNIENILEAMNMKMTPGSFEFRAARAEFLHPVVTAEKLELTSKKITGDDITKIKKMLATWKLLNNKTEKSLEKLKQ